MHAAFWWESRKEGKRLLRRRMRRWEDNIKTDLIDIIVLAWTGLVCLRTVTSAVGNTAAVTARDAVRVRVAQ
jgi:hypothetical protein